MSVIHVVVLLLLLLLLFVEGLPEVESKSTCPLFAMLFVFFNIGPCNQYHCTCLIYRRLILLLAPDFPFPSWAPIGLAFLGHFVWRYEIFDY